MTHGSRSTEQALDATVDSLVYEKADGSFAVARVTQEPDGDNIVVVGALGQLRAGEMLRFRGQWQNHTTYGRRFVVSSFTPITPSTTDGLARYLGSGLVPGVGASIAKRLVDKFGAETLDIVTQQSARLCEVPGIGKRRANAIAEAVRTQQAQTERLAFLHGLGLGPGLVNRLHRRYGKDAARVVRDDPYLVAEQVPGVGFKTADRIGLASGITVDDPRRAEAAVLHLVGRSVDHGHVFTTRVQLESAVAELKVAGAAIDPALGALVQRKLLVLEGSAVYAKPLHEAESKVARRLRELAKQEPHIRNRAQALAQLGSGLAAAQRRAVEATLQHQLLVVTGGPGTGKTTTVRAIVRCHRAAGRRVQLCAPTGRAAKRLAEAAGAEALTIHRLLEFNPATRSFQRNRELPIEADLLLVDEASMLDLILCQHLLAALPRRCCLVLVGDVNQLPPVGAGHVLRDLIASGVSEIVRLTEVFRQAQQSAIVTGAHAVLAGTVPRFTPSGSRGSGDLFWVPARDPELIAERLLASLRRAREAYRLDPVRDVQVLVPMHKGPIGTERLNLLLQQTLNPKPNPSAGPPTGLHAGDKVMQLRNDYEREVFNGDVGEVTEVKSGITFARMGGRAVAFERDALDALTLAYACTVHKVQGSEFPAAFVILHGTHHVMLSRALLYTAITRARKLVVLIGDERALLRAIENDKLQQVNTRLTQRLRQPATDAG